MSCEHHIFAATVDIARIEDIEPMAFVAHIRVKCAECGQDFMFPGLPRGIDITEPMAGIGGIEARLPIRVFERDRDMGQGETMRVHIP